MAWSAGLSKRRVVRRDSSGHDRRGIQRGDERRQGRNEPASPPARHALMGEDFGNSFRFFCLGRGGSGLATREDGAEARVGQDACDSVTVITLNLDPSFFDGASSTTSLLHVFRQPLFLGLTDADKSCDDCHCLPSPVRGRTKDIHPAAISFWFGWGLLSEIPSRGLGSR